MSFFNELKRRKVIRVGVGYVIIAWVVAQVLQLVFESFGTPDWAIKSTLVVLATGLPFALFFAWVYELTPDGLKREQELERSQPITLQTMKKLKSDATSPGNLRSMVYKSCCKGVADWNLVTSILASSNKNNPTHNITGVLVVTETQFLQVLEGEFEALNATFEKISRDTRHHKVQLISFSEIEEREFGDWGMHGIGLFNLNRELSQRLCSEFGQDNGVVRLPSTASRVFDLLNILLPEKELTHAPD